MTHHLNTNFHSEKSDQAPLTFEISVFDLFMRAGHLYTKKEYIIEN